MLFLLSRLQPICCLVHLKLFHPLSDASSSLCWSIRPWSPFKMRGCTFTAPLLCYSSFAYVLDMQRLRSKGKLVWLVTLLSPPPPFVPRHEAMCCLGSEMYLWWTKAESLSNFFKMGDNSDLNAEMVINNSHATWHVILCLIGVAAVGLWWCFFLWDYTDGWMLHEMWQKWKISKCRCEKIHHIVCWWSIN